MAAMDLTHDANRHDVVLSVSEVTTLVWLLDLAVEEGGLHGEAAAIAGRTRRRLTERAEAVTAGS